MTMLIILLLCLVWFLLGISGFIFWWTKDLDLTVSDAIMAIFIGACVGPFSFIVGFCIHGQPSNKILIKNRKR